MGPRGQDSEGDGTPDPNLSVLPLSQKAGLQSLPGKSLQVISGRSWSPEPLTSWRKPVRMVKRAAL